MKKNNNYTLIELLAAMVVFIIMMGVLFNIFSSAANIATSDVTKTQILSDANTFFRYITEDLKNAQIKGIPAPETTSGGSDGTDFSKDLVFSASSLEFYSDTTAYDTLAGTMAAGVPPFIKYDYVAGTNSGVIMRVMGNGSATTPAISATAPIILEGVKSFVVKVWSDRPGGNEITSSPADSSTDANTPLAVTITLTLTNPSPTMSDTLRNRADRTLSKTIYLK